MLITGGAGFIGSHLVRRLHSENAYVLVVDNFSIGDIKYIIGYADEIISKNVSDEDFVKMFRGKDIDYILHFGAPSSVILFNKNPTKRVHETLFGFMNVMELVRAVNVKKVVYPSSGSVYGNIPIPQSEDMIPNPANLYGTCKLACEKIAKLYSDVPSVGLRIFAGYGPGEDHKGDIASVVTLFLKSILKDERPVIYGDGNQRRDFIYIDDVVEAILRATEAPVTTVINVGCGKNYSFNEVVDIINCLLGKEVVPVYVTKPAYYLENTLAKIKRMKELLGVVRSPMGLEEGLRKYIESIENSLL